MISAIKTKCREVAAIVPVKKMTGEDLSIIIRKVLSALHDAVFRVQVISSDNGKANRSAFSNLCGGQIKTYIDHPFGPGRLYFLFDPVHLMKSISYNWLMQADYEKTFRFPPQSFLDNLESPMLNILNNSVPFSNTSVPLPIKQGDTETPSTKLSGVIFFPFPYA